LFYESVRVNYESKLILRRRPQPCRSPFSTVTSTDAAGIHIRYTHKNQT
jgi:hypothetical protein